MDMIGELSAICADLNRITGIKAVVYDADMKIVYSHPDTMGPFCTAVRRDAGLYRQCLACDRAGFEQCRRSGDICIYQCHMGLTEAIAPIVEDGCVTGYVMFGQMLSENARQAVHERVDALAVLDEKTFLHGEIDRMDELSDDKIRAAVRLVSMCACYIRLNNVLDSRRETLPLRIGRYITGNLGSSSLTPTDLCSRFGVSRGTLYTLCKRTFGMGASEYIREARIREAVRLLRETDLPVFDIAGRVGIEDSDYLSKLIRKKTGLTPRQIRKADGMRSES